MPIFQILIVASSVIAISLGIAAFRGGIQVGGRSKKRITGTPAKIIGVLCLIYGVGVILAIGAVFAAIALGWM